VLISTEVKVMNFSHDARTLINIVCGLVKKKELDLFQRGPEIDRLIQIHESHRGNLCTALKARLREVEELGGVELITQKDVWALIEEIWHRNASIFSETEQAVLRESLLGPGIGIRDLAARAKLSYSQARRAVQRLRRAEVLRMEGALNASKLGLERVLVILEAPELVLSSPYITKTLFVDGSEPLVLLVATLPSERISDLLDMIRSLRSTSARASAWKLSAGQSRFNGKYCKPRVGWEFDKFHWSTQIRKSYSEIIVSDSSLVEERINFTPADLKIIDELVANFDATANEIVNATGLSDSTAFRKRASLLDDKVVVPRTRVRVPFLTDRVLVLSDPECAGNILTAWKLLPVTYLTKLVNLETSEKRVLQMAALPPGTSEGLIDALANWMSRVDNYSAHTISAGTEDTFKADAMFYRHERAWKWNQGDFFDARSFQRSRREAEKGIIPVDLA
jgi:DNA-binding Lrp family transcriptional regulator